MDWERDDWSSSPPSYSQRDELKLGPSLNEPTTILTDITAARQVAQNPVFHKRMKHTHIRHHFPRIIVKNKIARYQHTYSKENCSDMLVKALAKVPLRRRRKTCMGPYVAPAVVLTAEEQLAKKNA